MAALPVPAAGARRRLAGRARDDVARPAGVDAGRDRADGVARPRPSRRASSRPRAPRRRPGSRSSPRRCRPRSMEEIAAAAPGATRWFQLYAQADPGRTRDLVERAAAAGYGAIVLTVDLPVLGYRDRDRRSGFSLDVPHGNFRDGAEPTHGSHAGRTTARRRPRRRRRAVDQWIAKNLTWDSLATIRSWSPLPLVLKGILTAEDARLAVEHGVDAIVVSNHGGRQLDRVAAPRSTCSRRSSRPSPAGTEVWVDGGVRRGLDVAIALRARRARRARRPADPVGARGGRSGRRGAGARDPARGVRAGARAARRADTGGPDPRPHRLTVAPRDNRSCRHQGRAPAASSARAISAWPRFRAWVSGRTPSLSARSTSAPFSIRRSTTS